MDNGSVLILYKYVDGAHFFIGGDKMSDGVCVANADIYVAYQEVTAQLAILAKENFGKEWTFEPEVSPEELTEWVRDSSAPKKASKILPLPQALVPWGEQGALVAAYG